jgi:hypothetical protein
MAQVGGAALAHAGVGGLKLPGLIDDRVDASEGDQLLRGGNALDGAGNCTDAGNGGDVLLAMSIPTKYMRTSSPVR